MKDVAGIVRAVDTSDFVQWECLWDGYNRFYRRVISLEVTKTTWSRFFDPAEPVYALVVEQEQKLIGMATYVFHRNTAIVEPICYLQDLFTAEAVRGRGVGRALIEGIYERAKDAGVRHVYWLTHETNLTARTLYDKVAEPSGFVMYSKAL